MTHAYILTTIRDDGEAFTTKFEGYLAESAADAAFRECSGAANKYRMVYAQLKLVNDRRGEVRSQWPKFDPDSTTYYTPPMPQAPTGLPVSLTTMSDKVRKQLEEVGWKVYETPSGSKWAALRFGQAIFQRPTEDQAWQAVHEYMLGVGAELKP